MADSSSADIQVATLLDQFGQTYAQEAGIRLADKPSPLYELLVLATLLSARISADIAVAAARELFAAGYRTPRAMQEASWQDRVNALGRGRYKRYDERTATMLGDGAALAVDRWHGDLRRLRDEADGEPGRIESLLQEFQASGRPGPPSSCARCRVSGLRWLRTWTTGSARVPGSWGGPMSRTPWLAGPDLVRTWTGWPRPWSGSRSQRTLRNSCVRPRGIAADLAGALLAVIRRAASRGWGGWPAGRGPRRRCGPG